MAALAYHRADGRPYRVPAKVQKGQSVPGIECLACGLVNQARRRRCDCGFELRPTHDQARRTLATRADARVVDIMIGVAAIAGSVGFSYAMYAGAVASGSGGFVIFTSAIIYGFIKVIYGYRGLREVRKLQREMRRG
jgi:hypothetical protein